MSFGDWLQQLRTGSWTPSKARRLRRPRHGRANPAVVQIQALEPRRLLTGVTAVDDSYSVTLPADMPEPVTLDVLANDDGNGETPAITSVTSPANGSAWIETAAESGLGHDVIRVAPTSGFDGVLTFSYTIGNSLEESGTATVTVTVDSQQQYASFWDSPEGQAFLATFDSAKATHDAALTAAADAYDAANLVTQTNLVTANQAASSLRTATNLAAKGVYDAAEQSADDALQTSNSAAQSAYGVAAQAAATTQAANDLTAWSAYQAAEVAAAQNFSTANASAYAAMQAAADAATTTEQNTQAAAAATLTGILTGIHQTYLSAVQAAYDAYNAASANYSGNGYTIPFDQWSDSTYTADLQAAQSTLSSEIAAADSQLQGAVAGAQATHLSGSAPLDAAYNPAIATNQATYDAAEQSALIAYAAAIAANQAVADSASASHWATLQAALVANEAAYNSEVAAADAVYQAAVNANAAAYSAAAVATDAALSAAAASNQVVYAAAIAALEAAFDSAITSANVAYDAVASDPSSTSADIEAAEAVWAGAIRSAFSARIVAKASAITAKDNADAIAENAWAKAINAASTAAVQADAQAANVNARSVNSADAAKWQSDEQAGAAYQRAQHATAVQQEQADAQAALTETLARNAAAKQQASGDSQALTTWSNALANLDQAYLIAVANADAARESQVRRAEVECYAAEANALAASKGRWAASEGTPDAMLEADLEAAIAASASSAAPAIGDYNDTVEAAKAQKVSDFAPGWLACANALVANAQTYVSAVAPAVQQLADALAANALAYITTMLPLGQALDDALVDNEATWVGAIIPAAEAQANAEADAELAEYNSQTAALQTAVDQIDDNDVTAQMAESAADSTYFGTVASGFGAPGMPPGLATMIAAAIVGADPDLDRILGPVDGGRLVPGKMPSRHFPKATVEQTYEFGSAIVSLGEGIVAASPGPIGRSAALKPISGVARASSSRYQQLVKQAQLKYPHLAGKEWHHITPRYLGGCGKWANGSIGQGVSSTDHQRIPPVAPVWLCATQACKVARDHAAGLRQVSVALMSHEFAECEVIHMLEAIEFRIPERSARNHLEPAIGTLLGDSVRKLVVDTSDPLFLRIGAIESEFRAADRTFFTAWIMRRRYTKQELDSAHAFHFQITKTFEPAGEECGTIYNETTACPGCGAGAAQASDLRLDLRKAPKNKDIAVTIAGEIIVSQRLAERVVDAGLTGCEFRPVRHKARYEDDAIDLARVPSGRLLLEQAEAAGVPHPTWNFWVWLNRPENDRLCQQARVEAVAMKTVRAHRKGAPLPVWHQLIVPSSVDIVPPTRVGLDPFDEDEQGECRCPRGDTIGLNLLSELSISQRDFSNVQSDVLSTRQYIGVRRGLLRPERRLIISPRFRTMLEQHDMTGFRLEVAHLVP
ncbi:MAG: hypothetical protein SH850_00645 [Planctomycetaceae bacterium]|nr:hypothetical protein [Planctomycetaceae bacterium]